MWDTQYPISPESSQEPVSIITWILRPETSKKAGTEQHSEDGRVSDLLNATNTCFLACDRIQNYRDERWTNRKTSQEMPSSLADSSPRSGTVLEGSLQEMLAFVLKVMLTTSDRIVLR